MTYVIEGSWRYVVVGFYKDRNERIVRIYPIPFVRITLRY